MPKSFLRHLTGFERVSKDLQSAKKCIRVSWRTHTRSVQRPDNIQQLATAIHPTRRFCLRESASESTRAPFEEIALSGIAERRFLERFAPRHRLFSADCSGTVRTQSINHFFSPFFPLLTHSGQFDRLSNHMVGPPDSPSAEDSRKRTVC